MESSFQLMIAHDMFYYVKFTALFIKILKKDSGIARWQLLIATA